MLLKLFILCVVLIPSVLIMIYLNDKFGKDNERFRKIVHIFHGVALASLAFILPLEALVVLEIVFLVSMLIAKYLYRHFSWVPWIKYMGRMYKVGRVSYGEFFFPVSVIVTVYLADSKAEFAASILVLGLADAAAALIGKRFGASNRYTILGQQKSVMGSVAFFIVATLVVGGFVLFGGAEVANPGIATIIVVSLLLTISENLGVYGSDNFLIPLVSVMLLNHL